MKRLKIAYIFLIAIYASNIWSNPASLDTSFNGTGLATIPSFTGSATGAALQPDGKIVVTGFTTPVTSPNNFVLARFNPDGTLDTTFNAPNGYVLATFSSGSINNALSAAAIDSDGNIIVVGSLIGQSFIARYTSDGILDTTTFASPNGFLYYEIGDSGCGPTSMIIQPNGMILVGGWSANSDSYWAGYVARFTSDGAFDTSFGVSDHYGNNHGYSTIDPFGFGVGTASGQSIALQPNGNILLCGTTQRFSASNEYTAFISRLNGTTGALDLSFGGSGTGFVTTQFGSQWSFGGVSKPPLSGATGMQLTEDGDILITGAGSNNNTPINSTTPDTSLFLARYNSAGILDTTFNSTGSAFLYLGPLTIGYGLAISATNKITAIGTATLNGIPYTQFIARYNPDGSLDTTLNPLGYIVSSITYNPTILYVYVSVIGYQPTVQTDGKLITVGQFGSNLAVNRYIGGSIPFSPTPSIALYGQNSDYILDFLMVNFYAGVITDPTAQAAAIDTMHTIIASYAADYVDQPNFNFISYLYLIKAQINNAQADLIFAYPDSTAQLNLFFVYINDQIATLNNL